MIPLVRADNRLLHGQILEAWVPRLGVDEVVVADDEAAGSTLARAAMTLCVPPDLPVRIERLGDVRWDELAAAKDRILVLVRDVESLTRARAAGLTPAMAPRLNLGNLHFGPGRLPITASVFVTRDELAAIRELAEAGFDIEVRAIPSEPPAGMADIERRYAAAR